MAPSESRFWLFSDVEHAFKDGFVCWLNNDPTYVVSEFNSENLFPESEVENLPVFCVSVFGTQKQRSYCFYFTPSMLEI